MCRIPYYERDTWIDFAVRSCSIDAFHATNFSPIHSGKPSDRLVQSKLSSGYVTRIHCTELIIPESDTLTSVWWVSGHTHHNVRDSAPFNFLQSVSLVFHSNRYVHAFLIVHVRRVFGQTAQSSASELWLFAGTGLSVPISPYSISTPQTFSQAVRTHAYIVRWVVCYYTKNRFDYAVTHR